MCLVGRAIGNTNHRPCFRSADDRIANLVKKQRRQTPLVGMEPAGLQDMCDGVISECDQLIVVYSMIPEPQRHFASPGHYGPCQQILGLCVPRLHAKE